MEVKENLHGLFKLLRYKKEVWFGSINVSKKYTKTIGKRSCTFRGEKKGKQFGLFETNNGNWVSKKLLTKKLQGSHWF